jgi:broad specificity phosphatase PhoE
MRRLLATTVIVALSVVTCVTAVGNAAPQSTSPRARSATRVLRIYIARHGETASNAERRVLGQLDEPLSARGLEQALALRDRLRGVRLDAIYASPLARSLETAAIVSEGRSVRVLAALKERHQGRLQGMRADDVHGFTARMADPGDALDGGETTADLSRRVTRGLEIIRHLTPSGSVLVVGHFLTNQMLLRELLDLPVRQAMTINQANDELYVVEAGPGRHTLAWKLIPLARLGEL